MCESTARQRDREGEGGRERIEYATCIRIMQHISWALMTVVEVLESAAKSTFKKLTQHCRIVLCLLVLLCFAWATLMRVCVCVRG